MNSKSIMYIVIVCFFSTKMLGQVSIFSLWKSVKTSGEIELYGSYRDFSLISSRAKEESSSSLYAGKINLTNSSFIWHPNFMTMDVNMLYNPGAGNDISIIAPDGAIKRYSNVFSLRTNFLRKQKLSFGYFINFNNSFYSKENLTEFSSGFNNWGVELNYKSKSFPGIFKFNKSKEFEENKFLNRQLDTERNEFDLNIKNIINNWSNSELTASLKEYKHEMKNVYNRNIRYENFNFDNRIYYKKNRNYNLSTKVSKLRSLGYFNFDRFSINQNLNLTFNKKLLVRGAYNLSSGMQGDSKFRNNSFQTALSHNLYKSLKSRFIVKHDENRISDLEQNYNFISTGFDYTKKIPLNGRLNLNLNYSKQFETGFQPAKTNNLLVSFLISDETLNFIDDSNVVVESIEITDQTGSFLFLENIDYILIVREGLIEIQRLPGGNIANNSTIFLTYDTNNPGDYSFDFVNTKFSASIQFFNQMIELYFKSSSQKFENVFVNDLSIIRDFNSQNYGFNIRLKFLSLGYSFTDFQSDISPYTNDTFFISLNVSSEKIRYILGGTYNKINFLGLNKVTNLYTNISGQVSYQLSRNDLINLKMDYRNIEGQGIDLNLLTGSLTFSKKYKKLEFNLIADYYDKLFLQETNYKYSGIRMSITRRF